MKLRKKAMLKSYEKKAGSTTVNFDTHNNNSDNSQRNETMLKEIIEEKIYKKKKQTQGKSQY